MKNSWFYRKTGKFISLFCFISFFCSPFFIMYSSNGELDKQTFDLTTNKPSFESNKPQMASISDEPSLNREMFPINLKMGEHSTLYSAIQGLGEENIRIAYFSENYEWLAIPFQIDEIGSPYVWVDESEPPSGPSPELKKKTMYIPYGDPFGRGYDSNAGKLDDNDELSFYAHRGRKVSQYLWYNQTQFPKRIELAIVDPVDGGKSWMYIYYNPSQGFGRISSESWYQDYVNWNKYTLSIETPIYSYKLDANNLDLTKSIQIKTTDSLNLINSFKKRFIWSTMSSNEFGTSPEGSWPTNDGFINPGSYSFQKTAIDDSSDAYDSNEGNLQNAPSTNNDISGQGDFNAIIDGPIRVVLGRIHFEYTDTGTVLFVKIELFIHSQSTTMFYYNMMEELSPETDLDSPPMGIDMSVLYSFQDIIEINSNIRSDVQIHYGARSNNPNFESFTAGLRTLYPDGNPNNDAYAHGGDPTSKLSKILPNNPEMADWMMITTTTHGGMWRYLGREETSQNNVDELNIYWHDGVISETGFETEFTRPIPSDGVHLPSFWVRTIFGDFKNSDNIYSVGDIFHKQKKQDLADSIIFTIQDFPSSMPIFTSIIPNKKVYSSGDIIQIDIKCDNPGYILSADFSTFDSNYQSGDELISNLGQNYYRITYHISTTNTKVNDYYRISISAKSTTYTSIDNT